MTRDKIIQCCELFDIRPSTARLLFEAVEKMPTELRSDGEARALVQDIAQSGELVERRAEVISILLSC